MKKTVKWLTVVCSCVLFCLGAIACKEEHMHTYVDSVTAPTCTEQGYTTHTCDCGKSYVDTYVNALGHTYNQQIANDKYLKSPATCTSKAVYYKSCVCGEKGSKTFEYGRALDHEYTNYVSNNDATCTKNGTETAKCNHTGCKATDTRTIENSKLSHTYDQEIVNDKYLKSPATCTNKAVYYMSCVCGEKGSETFEYGNFAAHSVQTTWDYDETHHWHNSVCSCNVKVDFEKHTIDDSGCCTVCEQAIFPTDGVYYDVSADGTYAEVIGYTGTATTVKIADTYEGLSVTSVYSNAFKNAKIVSVTIPDSVTFIGNNAFYGCSSLTSVTIGNSVTSIGNNAFYGCSSLTSVTIGNSVTSIGNNAFYGCSSLTSITIPDSVTFIGDNAFYGCSSLQYNTFGKLNYLGNERNPYMVVISLVSPNFREYEISSTAKIIPSYAFISCTRLTNITIPDSVTSIGFSAFEGCSSLTKATLPAFAISYIPKTNLKTVIITSGKSIGYHAFENCSSLTSVTIPDSVTSIGGFAFYNCSGLTSVTIPDSVTSIGSYAFSGCSSLTSVYYSGTAEDWAKISIGNNNSYLTSATRYYYSETNPFEGENAVASGNYWHYVNGVPTIWR